MLQMLVIQKALTEIDLKGFVPNFKHKDLSFILGSVLFISGQFHPVFLFSMLFLGEYKPLVSARNCSSVIYDCLF